MSSMLSDEQLQKALDECASEPVHIPGHVQPFGALIAMDPKTEVISYASANCDAIAGYTASNLLGRSFSDVFGPDIAHATRNAAGRPDFTSASLPLGVFTVNGKPLEFHAFGRQGMIVVEFEEERDVAFGTEQAIKSLVQLIETIETCKTEKDLLNTTVDFMRYLTGFDRIMVYKFDLEFNGEVIAEVMRPDMEPFLGLRFPKYDIPPQVREIMAVLPLRVIQDATQTPVPLLAANDTLPPLDISFAATRGVSPVHMEYLKNMGSQATMTLSIVVDDALWGIISFHHEDTYVPPAKLRNVLTKFQSVFSAKLEVLQQREMVRQINSVDQFKDTLLSEINDELELDAFFPSIAPTIVGVLKANGATAIIEDKTWSYGQVPDDRVLDALLKQAQEDASGIIAIDNLEKAFPKLGGDLNGLGGALVHVTEPGRAIILFRGVIERQIAWAGNPEKTVETVSGRTRLAPRGSFMTYLEHVSGACEPWTEQDLNFANSIWTIVSSAERRTLLNTLNRQQSIMIDELNHRVRNILALIRSLARQVLRRDSAMESYSKSLEARIQALATVHDITSGSKTTTISLHELINLEFAPYRQKSGSPIRLSGENPSLRADITPILSLVIHELTTNAAKYGALSTDDGHVDVTVLTEDGGYRILWQEEGGPPVAAPEKLGFGSTLIREAIQHEINGTSKLDFKEQGVSAEIFLPDELFRKKVEGALRSNPIVDLAPQDKANSSDTLSKKALEGGALVLEDNYVIAKEMGDQLREFGFDKVAIFANVEKALGYVPNETPSVAVLDVNLGGTESSTEFALRLRRMNVPVLFITGYGDKAELPSELQDAPCLAKPVRTGDLKSALTSLLHDI